MKETVFRMKDVSFGTGLPKICVPITDTTGGEILETVRGTNRWNCEVVEWRADFYEGLRDTERFGALLAEFKDAFTRTSPEKLSIFTVRTASDGGIEIPRTEYLKLTAQAIGFTHLIDVEYHAGAEAVRDIIVRAHDAGTGVIVSYHDFEKTPSEDELVHLLCAMQDTGADMVKAAVMPQTDEDVDRLMMSTKVMKESYARVPLIAMSMGDMGHRSRVRGESFGSAMTFASVKKSSAPGQVGLEQMRSEITEYHNSLMGI